jgi:predicted MFS family arabinose efflux permease
VTDLAPPDRPSLAAAVNTASPSVGLALGAVASGLLGEHAPAPRSLVFALLAAVFVLLLAALAIVPETVASRSGALASLRPAAAVPQQARSAFRRALPVLVATWAVGGLVLSLGPSLAVGVLGLRSHLTGGLVVAAVVGVSAVSSVQSRRVAAPTAMVRGALVLAAGVAVVLAGLGTRSEGLFFAGLVVTGWGFGAAFVGAFGSVASLATATQRAELFAAVYVASYVAFGVCAVLAGLAVPHFGLRPVATAYGAVVIALSLTAAVTGRRPRLAVA